MDVSVQTELPVEAVVRNGKYTVSKIQVQPDVIVFQRPLLEAFYDTMLFAQKKGIACVVEIDDDLKATDPGNIAYDAMNPKTSPTSNWDFLVKCCDIADLVICSTSELARRYAPHGRFRVLRNRIPAEEFKREKIAFPELRVGWTGTVQTHPQDIDAAGSHIGAAIANYADDPNFYVVGDGQFVKEKLHLHGDVIPTGWVPREDYLHTMNGHIDIGVVPLKLDQFNHSKSWLKSLEMASQGIPSVVSPTIENTLLSEVTGNPIATKMKDWQKHLKRLLTDRDFYDERSWTVRESVSSMTYENHVEDWIEAWNSAVENRVVAKY